ncbi:MAG: hypothetical protein AAFY56_11485 [Pseudomonadota bacterium]
MPRDATRITDLGKSIQSKGRRRRIRSRDQFIEAIHKCPDRYKDHNSGPFACRALGKKLTLVGHWTTKRLQKGYTNLPANEGDSVPQVSMKTTFAPNNRPKISVGTATSAPVEMMRSGCWRNSIAKD